VRPFIIGIRRDDRWSEAIAVASLAFVEKVKGELGVNIAKFEPLGGSYALRERSDAYRGEFTRENAVLRVENTISWEKNAARAL
jgi:hypothetical protein